MCKHVSILWQHLTSEWLRHLTPCRGAFPRQWATPAHTEGGLPLQLTQRLCPAFPTRGTRKGRCPGRSCLWEGFCPGIFFQIKVSQVCCIFLQVALLFSVSPQRVCFQKKLDRLVGPHSLGSPCSYPRSCHLQRGQARGPGRPTPARALPVQGRGWPRGTWPKEGSGATAGT